MDRSTHSHGSPLLYGALGFVLASVAFTVMTALFPSILDMKAQMQPPMPYAPPTMGTSVSPMPYQYESMVAPSPSGVEYNYGATMSPASTISVPVKPAFTDGHMIERMDEPTGMEASPMQMYAAPIEVQAPYNPFGAQYYDYQMAQPEYALPIIDDVSVPYQEPVMYQQPLENEYRIDAEAIDQMDWMQAVGNVCDDGIDNDGDGLVDGGDPACPGSSELPYNYEMAEPAVDPHFEEYEMFAPMHIETAPAAMQTASEVVTDNFQSMLKSWMKYMLDALRGAPTYQPPVTMPISIPDDGYHNAPPSESSCTDKIDNDYDQMIDCSDSDCSSDPACAMHETQCSDGKDNDGDYMVDCQDEDCVAFPGCGVAKETHCSNRVDDDRDVLIDCADDDCARTSACASLR